MLRKCLFAGGNHRSDGNSLCVVKKGERSGVCTYLFLIFLGDALQRTDRCDRATVPRRVTRESQHWGGGGFEFLAAIVFEIVEHFAAAVQNGEDSWGIFGNLLCVICGGCGVHLGDEAVELVVKAEHV